METIYENTTTSAIGHWKNDTPKMDDGVTEKKKFSQNYIKKERVHRKKKDNTLSSNQRNNFNKQRKHIYQAVVLDTLPNRMIGLSDSKKNAKLFGLEHKLFKEFGKLLRKDFTNEPVNIKNTLANIRKWQTAIQYLMDKIKMLPVNQQYVRNFPGIENINTDGKGKGRKDFYKFRKRMEWLGKTNKPYVYRLPRNEDLRY